MTDSIRESSKLTATETEEHHWYPSDAHMHVASLLCGCAPTEGAITWDTHKRVVHHRSTPEESSARTVREMRAWIRAGYGTD